MGVRQRDFWPILPDAQDVADTQTQWLDNLSGQELAGHALLFATTPLERVLAKELAALLDGCGGGCEQGKWLLGLMTCGNNVSAV